MKADVRYEEQLVDLIADREFPVASRRTTKLRKLTDDAGLSQVARESHLSPSRQLENKLRCSADQSQDNTGNKVET